MTAFAAYGRNDLRNIRRDQLLAGVMAGPFIYSLTSWFVHPLTDYLHQSHQFELQPYYPLIVSAFLVLGPIAVLGAVCGLILLEDKDQRTLAALRVTPTSPMSYPVYRSIMILLVVIVSESAALLISPLVGPADLVGLIPVTVLSGVQAVIIGLIMAAWAKNKVEGLAVVRALGLMVFMLPLIPWFIDSPSAWWFGLLPSFWPAKATWLSMTGQNHWPTILIGMLYSVALCCWLLRRFTKRY